MKTKHPKGLPFLFFTEMWERFGYYLILGIFVLYDCRQTECNIPSYAFRDDASKQFSFTNCDT